MTDDDRPEYEAARADLNAAVDAYCERTNPGTMVTGWVLCLCSVSVDQLESESRGYSWTMMPNQPYHSTLGLLMESQSSMQYRGEER